MHNQRCKFNFLSIGTHFTYSNENVTSLKVCKILKLIQMHRKKNKLPVPGDLEGPQLAISLDKCPLQNYTECLELQTTGQAT